MTNNKNETEQKRLESTILSACFDVGKRINENAFNIANTDWKSLDDPVTNLDKESERFIIEKISEKFNVNFYGEEYGIQQNGSKINIYIDPIDGTKSFVRGEFLTSVTVAAEKDGELIFGAVYDFARDIMYYANGEGAFLTRSTWTESKTLPREIPTFSKKAMLYTDDGKYNKLLEGMSQRTQIGSVALSMAQTAAGVYEGFIAMPHKKNGSTDIGDIATGYFIMKQAGLFIKDYDLKEYDYKHPENGIVALTNELAEKYLSQSARN